LISYLRRRFNETFRPELYRLLRQRLETACSSVIDFRLAETPIFLERALLDEMASAGARLCMRLLADKPYLTAAAQAIPHGYRVAGQTERPHFLTADFALVQTAGGRLEPRLVEIQAFPSVYALQAELYAAYREVYGAAAGLDASLGTFLSGLDEGSYWELLRATIVANHDPETVALVEVDPRRQKTWPDFAVTARRLGIAVVDIAQIMPQGDKLHYRADNGKLIPIKRIYNRAIVDELISRRIELPFDLERPWDVEWAGHPNWYFLISKFSIPWLCGENADPVVPPAVFLSDFLAGPGRAQMEQTGVVLPAAASGAIYHNLLLKPLFSFAGKGIQFDPTQADLESIPADRRGEFLLQQRMSFVHTIETPHGLTQAEIRILYLWPDGGELTPTLSLVRLGRGKMMGVDHNRNQEWVGASGAFFPQSH
jgi:hypothetical protein